MVSGRLPVRLRHSGTRIVTEEPRSATAAMRTSRYGRTVIEHLVESLDQTIRLAHSTGLPKAASLGDCTLSAGVARINSTQARLDCLRLEGFHSP